MKKVIISADDFGYSKENNEAILIGFQAGNITSAGLMANMNGFDNAVNEVLPAAIGLDIGFHFNIVEGKALTNANLLCDSNGGFNCGFFNLLLSQNNKKLLAQIEAEFRAQIEKVLKYTTVSHVDSHVHVHSIPAIFNLVVKLAKEYNVQFVRTQNELPYVVSEKILNSRFSVNVIKNILLNVLSNKNRKFLNANNVLSNDYIIGVLYTGYMDENAIYNGLKRINKQDSVTEVLFHPYLPEDISCSKRMNNYREFLITKTPKLRENLKNIGFDLVSYADVIKNIK